MIDTNQINQVGDAVRDAAAQVKTNWPAITAAAFIVAREIGRFNTWLAGIGEAVIEHGGIIWIVRKLFWNPPMPAAPANTPGLLTAIKSIPPINSEKEEGKTQ